MIIDDSEKSIYTPISINLRACIDWISFTINPLEKMSALFVIDFLGFNQDDFSRMPKGANGYKSMLKLNGSSIRLLLEGKENMGIHVDVPSSGLSDLLFAWKKKNSFMTPFKTKATQYKDFDFNLLLDLLRELSNIATFTRIDLAIDDIGCNYFSCDDVMKPIEEGRLISKFRKYDNRLPRLLKDNSKTGHTIYIGSRESQIMLRIYDKKLEFFHRHNSECPYKWVRWELEMKKDRANKVVDKLLETRDLSKVCMGILSQYLRFIQLDNPVKIKCSNDPVWDKFIGDMKKMSLYTPENPKNLDDTRRWIDKYVGASLSAIIEADGGSLDFIYKNLPKWKCRREKNSDLTNRLVSELKKNQQ